MKADIKNTSNLIRFSTPINEGSKRKFLLMKEDYITLKFSLDNPVVFKLGDYVDDTFGLFELTDPYKPTYNNTDGGYDYDLRLDAHYWKWKNKIFKFMPEAAGSEASWNLTADLATHMGVFLRNLTALGYAYRNTAFTISIGSTVENSAKLMSYDNTNLLDTLTKLAEAWECEWWVTDSVIHFGRCEYSDPVDFKLGDNVEEMTSSDSKNTFATRIYAFGSTRNLPTNYRPIDESVVVNGIVQKRLMLPAGTPYIDAYQGMSAEEAIEDVVIFEDVYPRRTGTISGIHTHEYTDIIKEEGKPDVIKKWNAYRFKDSGITFSEKYVIPGQELRIVFQSEALNGMDFAVTFNPCDKEGGEASIPEKNEDGSWNPLAQVWEIVRNEDYDRELPGDTLIPKNGDTYILYGYDTKFVAETMIPEAEVELKEKALKYLEKAKIDPSTYNCKMMSNRMLDSEGKANLLEAGDKVNLINEAYFETGNRQSRIIGFEYNLDFPYDSPVYTVGETASYSRIGALEDKIEALTYKGQTYTGGGGGVYLITSNDSTQPTDRNAYSAKRAKKESLSKTTPDSTPHLLSLLGGAEVEGGLKADSITTLNLLVQELADIYDLDVTHVATMFRTIIKDYVSSETFIPGLMGEGMKIYKALNGDWNLEVDNAVIRKTMTIFELIISKIRAVNGGLVISPANGRIKSVAETTGDPTYYVLGIEGDMEFVADDLVRCQVFTTGQVKYYWVPVASVTTDSVLVLKSEFANGVTPVPGDDLIQMGNRTNTARQGLLYLTASEDGKPRFSVMDGIDSTSLVGKSKVILGCLDGMTDTDFPADFQPSGYGLYAMNVFLKGVFLLRNGKSVESEIDAAKDAAQDAQDKADAVTRLFQEFTVAGGLFESKITEVKTYAENKADAAKNAAIDAAALDAQNKASAAQAAAELVAIAQAALAKTEASAYADGIVTAEEQRAINDAKAKLEEAKLDATTKADAAKNAAIEDAVGKYNTKSEVSSLISQTKDEINLSVTEKISNVQVGGTNHLRNSGNWRSAGWNGGFGDNGGGYTIDNSVLYNGLPTLKTDVGTGLIHSWLKLQNGVWYTYSAMVRCNKTIYGGASTPLHSWAGKDNLNQGKTEFLSYDTSVIADEWKLIHLTFRLTDDADSFCPIFYRGANESTFYWIAYFKLERGNKPTDWTPAPEDVQTQITANASAIEINKQGIALKASQSEVNGLGNRLTSAESSLSVQAGQIAAQVSSVNALTGRMSSAEIALQPGNIWLGIKDSVQANIPNCVTQVDTRSLDPNKYYLVTIGMSTTLPYTITVERTLAPGYGVPPYATHLAGFSVICKWQSNGDGWGVIPVKRIIQTLEYNYVYSCPVGNIGQIHESSEEYIYVRGGSLYNVRVDGTSSAPVTLRTSTHTPYPDYPSSSRPGVIDSVEQPVPDLDTKPSKDELLSTGIDISNRKIVLTSDKVVFQNNSGNQIALFENDRIKADLIDAKKIVTGVLSAESVTANNLTISGNSKIGGWSVSGNDLTCNGEGSARLRVEVDGYDFLRINDSNDAFLTIRRDTGKCVRLYTYDPASIALDINAGKGTALSVYGKIKTQGNTGQSTQFEINSVWNSGYWRKANMTFTNGILTGFWFTS